MFWQEDELSGSEFKVPDDVQDMQFSIDCRDLPVDHAYPLCQAVVEQLPWLNSGQNCAIHQIHGAESGNGWERPDGAEDTLYLSRRTRLVLRLPQHRVADARALTGKTLSVCGRELVVKGAKLHPLSANHTQYTRHLVDSSGGDEEQFIGAAVSALRALELRFKKVLCGRHHTLSTPAGTLITRSLMVAELPPADAVRLQQQGLGNEQLMGCGVFIPHKTFS